MISNWWCPLRIPVGLSPDHRLSQAVSIHLQMTLRKNKVAGTWSQNSTDVASSIRWCQRDNRDYFQLQNTESSVKAAVAKMQSVFLKATQDAVGFCPRQCGMGGGSTSQWPQNRVRTEAGPGRRSGHEEGPLRSSRDVALHSQPHARPWQPLRPPVPCCLLCAAPSLPPSLQGPPALLPHTVPDPTLPSSPQALPLGNHSWASCPRRPPGAPAAQSSLGSIFLPGGPASITPVVPKVGSPGTTCLRLPDGSGSHQGAWAAPQRQARETQGRVQALHPSAGRDPESGRLHGCSELLGGPAPRSPATCPLPLQGR